MEVIGEKWLLQRTSLSETGDFVTGEQMTLKEDAKEIFSFHLWKVSSVLSFSLI